jgi:hypothetical protein
VLGAEGLQRREDIVAPDEAPRRRADQARVTYDVIRGWSKLPTYGDVAKCGVDVAGRDGADRGVLDVEAR